MIAQELREAIWMAACLAEDISSDEVVDLILDSILAALPSPEVGELADATNSSYTAGRFSYANDIRDIFLQARAKR